MKCLSMTASKALGYKIRHKNFAVLSGGHQKPSGGQNSFCKYLRLGFFT
jgi:hypothetical protein